MAAEPRLTLLGKLFVALFVGGCLAGAAYMLWPGSSSRAPGVPGGPGGPGLDPGQAASPNGSWSFGSAPAVKIGIAYGTEKRRWLEWALEEFKKSAEGKSIQVELIPMGSIEGADAVVGGDERIHVWSPASQVYEGVFRDKWSGANRSGDPIVSQEVLALTPLVLVFWEERYRALTPRYPEIHFASLSNALAEPTGWQGIANKPDWGVFKMGITNPTESNSGLLTLLLLAYDFHDKARALQMSDILDAGFQARLRTFASSVDARSNSTGNLGRDMIQRGPSVYDVTCLYENVAIDFMKSAQGRWGNLQVVYPERNIWSDNPYYILNVPWSSEEQRRAAKSFLDFLLSLRIQEQALVHGFRPANVDVAIKGPQSPFERYGPQGVRIDVGEICEPPPPEVIFNLLTAWQRLRTR